MVKIITKRIHRDLDRFISNQTIQSVNENEQAQTPIVKNEPKSEPAKKTIKKRSDGLIEKLDNKIYITEDNRQLLND